MVAIGTASRMATSVWLTASASCGSVEARIESELGGDQQILRADVLGLHVDEVVDPLGSFDRLDDRRPILRGRSLADQEALHLDGQDDGDDAQQDTDGEGGDAVPDGVVGERGEPDAAEGQKEADQGAEVLEQHDRQLRHPGPLDELAPGELPLEGA